MPTPPAASQTPNATLADDGANPAIRLLRTRIRVNAFCQARATLYAFRAAGAFPDNAFESARSLPPKEAKAFWREARSSRPDMKFSREPMASGYLVDLTIVETLHPDAYGADQPSRSFGRVSCEPCPPFESPDVWAESLSGDQGPSLLRQSCQALIEASALDRLCPSAPSGSAARL